MIVLAEMFIYIYTKEFCTLYLFIITFMRTFLLFSYRTWTHAFGLREKN